MITTLLKTKPLDVCSIFLKSRCIHSNSILNKEADIADEPAKPDKEAIAEERRTLEEVFDTIAKKSNFKKTDTSRLLNPDLRDKQTVFSYEQPSFSSLINESKNQDETPSISHSSIHMSLKDIRKMPISLNPFNEVKMTRFEQAINDIKERENLKAALHLALSKHLQFLDEIINTDKDLLDITQQYLQLYITRNHDLEVQRENFIDDIKKRCESDPKQLPQPYTVTLPAVIRYLFESSKFEFPIERKYTVLFAIYNKCKSCKDLSMYLNVCNIDFYNLLLSYSWQNFQEPMALKDLIYEMDANGVHGDINTTEILQRIINKLENTADSILDLDFIQENHENSSMFWCKNNAHVVESLNDYLSNLKKSLT